MANKIEIATRLADKGFYLFPVKPNGKEPAFNGWQAMATRNKEQLAQWFGNSALNIGIFTEKFGDNEALVVVDVDQKRGKDGAKEIEKLELLGSEFPDTFKQTTPTTGQHIIYKTARPVKQGADVLAKGLDIRSRGGYIVAVGSEIDGSFYKAKDAVIAECPEWIVQKCGFETKASEDAGKKVEGINVYGAISRAQAYLEQAPIAVEGSGGDQTTYAVACNVKDFGVDQASAFGLLCDHWNNRCVPPWPIGELKQKIAHAYRYGSSAVGANAPEADFKPIASADLQGDDNSGDVPRVDQIEILNREYAFVTTGGSYTVIQECLDDEGNKVLLRIGEMAFHKRFASNMIMQRGKLQPLTKVWMNHGDRRSYTGFCFRPEQSTPKGKYNLWRGFSVAPWEQEPLPKIATDSLEMFKEHALQNICDNDAELCKWLMGYFAHLIQKPFEKPLTALVFKGRKGTGKNALVERVGRLIAPNFIVTADKRYLVSNFNSFLENNLLLVLDEAFWSGDKQAEGITKNLITGAKHMIEHKGDEPYQVPNLTRVVIIGNEEWLVPATQDERRFAVFNVGDGRRKDNKFFENMRVGMEQGGYSLLLTYLKNFDLTGIDINTAPSTEGLLEQKHASLDPVSQWWLECLLDGKIIHSDFGHDWPSVLETRSIYDAYLRYARERKVSGWITNNAQFGRHLRKISGALKGQKRIEGDRAWLYRIPTLAECRAHWDEFIGHKVKWPDTLA